MSKNIIFLVIFLCSSILVKQTSAEIADSNDKAHSTVLQQLDPILITPEKTSALAPIQLSTTTRVYLDESQPGQSSVTSVLQNTAGVSVNGQGGHLQSYSIRGISRQQVMTRIADMRVITDRRAGTSASFMDPLLIDFIEINRGASSSFFGSSALGGAINLQPIQFQGLLAKVGYVSNKNESFQLVGWGNKNTSVGVSVRTASDSENPNENELNDHFSQYSAVISKHWQWQDYDLSFLVIPALVKDIGKSNTDYPNRATTYPNDEHLLSKLKLVSKENNWLAEFYVHANSLDTRVNRTKESITNINHSAFDFGGKLAKEWQLGLLNIESGFDYFGRRNVTSNEKVKKFIDNSQTKQTTLDDGQENEFAWFNHVQIDLGSHHLNAGIRFSHLNQGQNHGNIIDTNVWSGYVSDQLTINNYFDLSALYSTGFRLPLLSERFFSGTTARGTVLGNTDLEAEFAHNFDLGISRNTENYSVSVHFFYTIIDDYIERIDIGQNLFTFVNLTSGTITGTEIEAELDIAEDMRLTFNATFMQGEDERGNHLNNLSANQLFFAYQYTPSEWEFGIQLRTLLNKNDVGPGERKTSAANILSASVQHDITRNISVSLFGNNLLNQSYLNSADDKAAEETGWSLGFQVNLILNE